MEIRRDFSGRLMPKRCFSVDGKKCGIRNILGEAWSLVAVKSLGIAPGCRDDCSQAGQLIRLTSSHNSHKLDFRNFRSRTIIKSAVPLLSILKSKLITNFPFV